MTTTQHQQPSISPDEAKAIAQEAWIFGMPLVYIEIQIDTATHVPKADQGRAPINQFVHYRAFPDASNRTVVGFNVDTLYSLAQLDLSKEPMVLSVPDMGKRFWVMQIIDAWNNVPHAPGSRTVGSKGGHFAIVGPTWKGTLPQGLTELRVPTNLALLGGRTYTGGPDDYAAVHALQDQYKLVPLSSWGKPYTPPDNVPLKEGVDAKTPVPKQVLALSPEDFFNRLNRLLVTNPPEPDDPKTMARLATLGIAPGATFRMDAFTPEVRKAIEAGVADGIKAMRETVRGKMVNGWQIALDMGRYGTSTPIGRAGPSSASAATCRRMPSIRLPKSTATASRSTARTSTRLHFTKAEIPPVDAFWSLTMYDDDAYLVANPINRYALGDRSHLTFDAEGGLTLYIQSDSPGKDKESNWLPAPKDAGFKLALRLYAPKKAVADGTWAPPPVKRAS